MPISPFAFGPDKVAPRVYPSSAASKTIAKPTAQWTYPTTWTEIVSAASMTTGFVLCGVTARFITSLQIDIAVEIGTGTASSEVTLDKFSFGGTIAGVVSDPVTFSVYHSQLLGPHYIPSGTRIAGRQAQDLASAWIFSAVYLYGFDVATPALAAKIIDQMQLAQGFATKGGDRLPTTDFVTLTHSGSAWTDGAWVEIDPAVSADTIIEGVTTRGASGADWTVQFGYGAAGVEVALPAYMPAMSAVSTTPQDAFIPCPFPLYVPKGARLVARQRCVGTTLTNKVAAKVTYLK